MGSERGIILLYYTGKYKINFTMTNNKLYIYFTLKAHIDKIMKTLYSKINMKKTAILVFSAFFMTISFLSLEFVLTHTNHSHEGIGKENSCQVCIIINSVNNLIKQLISTVKVYLPVIAGMLGVYLLLSKNTIHSEHYTLVNLKVRIDN